MLHAVITQVYVYLNDLITVVATQTLLCQGPQNVFEFLNRYIQGTSKENSFTALAVILKQFNFI